MAETGIGELSVMVVDDDLFFRELLSKRLTKFGIKNVIAAGSGRTAIEFLEHGAKEIHLVLLDLDMPDVNGVAFLRTLRKSPQARLAELPVIIVTGHDSSNVREGMEPFGILGFLGKPPDLAELESMIQAALRTAK